jgi:hypothetical protein
MIQTARAVLCSSIAAKMGSESRSGPTGKRRSRSRRPRSLELDSALLLDRRLFDRDHLALHLPKLGGRLLVSADEEGGGPEDYDRAVAKPSLVR